MTTVTIPKKVTKGEELVVIPRKDYEEFLRLKQQKAFSRLDKDLQESLLQVARGETYGPFNSVDEMMKSLEK